MLLQDLTYALRMMLKNRAFTITAVLVLALGIGANTVIFSVVNAVLLRPLPFPDSNRLIAVFESTKQLHNFEAVSGANFIDWRERNTSLEAISCYREDGFNLTGTSVPERVNGVIATPDLFRVLGVSPIIGRVFNADEDSLGNARVAVISQGLWGRRFGSDPNILGRKFDVNSEQVTIIGVMPASFRFPNESDLWIPPRHVIPEHVLRPTEDMSVNRDSHYLSAIGRVKAGVSFQQAKADLEGIGDRLEQEYPTNNLGRSVSVASLRDLSVGEVRPTILVLFGAVGFVLLIACANVANLLLARAATRQKEMAVRTALGASRFRLVRQLLTESVLLSTSGGAIGLLIALWGIAPLVALVPADLNGVKNIQIDGLVLGFTIAVSLLTGLLFGIVPAWQSTGGQLSEALKEGGRSGSQGPRRNRVRSILVVSEITLSLVLLIGAGLMIKSFIRLSQVDPGFQTSNILTMRLSLPPADYQSLPKRRLLVQQVVSRLQAIPGVNAAAAISRLPLTVGNSSRNVSIEGRPTDPNDTPSADYRVISPDYFSAMRIRVLKGREFTDQDNESSNVAIINDSMARRYWPGEEPIGQRIQTGNAGSPFLEIVGVVADIKHFGLDTDPKAEVYLPYTEDPWPFFTLITSGNSSASVGESMRSAVWAVDPNLPVPVIRSMDLLLSRSNTARRFNTVLLGIFGSVALILAAVGIYGVMSYAVTQRTHEIGVRMALGAKQSNVLTLVVGQGMRLALIGVGLGLIASFALTRVLTTLLFGVQPTDPVTFITISLILTGVALGACLLPAMKAMRVDPMVALRYE